MPSLTALKPAVCLRWPCRPLWATVPSSTVEEPAVCLRCRVTPLRLEARRRMLLWEGRARPFRECGISAACPSERGTTAFFGRAVLWGCGGPGMGKGPCGDPILGQGPCGGLPWDKGSCSDPAKDKDLVAALLWTMDSVIVLPWAKAARLP